MYNGKLAESSFYEVKTKIKVLIILGEVLAELCSRQECNRCVDWRISMKKFPNIKMEKDELREYLVFKHRGKKVEAKKGKGSKYSRSRMKQDNATW